MRTMFRPIHPNLTPACSGWVAVRTAKRINPPHG
jgi:hypothetical protein